MGNGVFHSTMSSVDAAYCFSHTNSYQLFFSPVDCVSKEFLGDIPSFNEDSTTIKGSLSGI